MPDATARAARLGRLFELLVGAESLTEFLDDLARLATDEIDRNVSCGLTVRTADGPVTVASSDELATELDQTQYRAGAGPCLEALATGAPVEVTDLAEAARWAAWQRAAAARGVRKSLSVPLTTSTAGQTIGALNLYSTSRDTFTGADRDAADAFAAGAAGAVMVATRLTEQAELLGHLETALTSRG